MVNKDFNVKIDGQICLKSPNSEKINKIISVCESLMFAYADPISKNDIKEIFKAKGEKISANELDKCINLLMIKYNEHESGLDLIIMDDKIQLATKSDNYEYLCLFLNPIKKKSLSQAALEALAVIAYKQPITKSEIEAIRGVKCDKAISTLIESKLIIEAGRLEKIGKPIIYKTSETFLKQFSLNSITDLPVLKDEIDD